MNWFTRRFGQKDGGDSGGIGIRSVQFDTSGLRIDRKEPERIEWVDRDNDRLVATIERDASRPDTLDVDALRTHYRQLAVGRSGGIVSVDVLRAAGLPVVQVVTKFEDRPAYVYEGVSIVPLNGARIVLTWHTREHGVTGTRDALVTATLLGRGVLRVPSGPPGSEPRRLEGWSVDPYDPVHDERALCSVSDDERLDELLPQHPLSKVRARMRNLAQTLTVDDGARPAIEEETWSPSDRRTRIVERVPAIVIAWMYLTVGRADIAETTLAGSIVLEHGEPAAPTAETGEALTALGHARELQGDLTGSEWAFLRAFRVLQSAIGDEHLDTLRAASNLGRVQASQQKGEEAEPVLRRVLPLLETHGTHIDVAVTLNALGLVQQFRGDHPGAVASFNRADDRFQQAETAQGRRISDRADVLNNLARSLETLGDRRGASAARDRARRAAQG